jgi:lipoyl-dependent peroxiredoxin subunit D
MIATHESVNELLEILEIQEQDSSLALNLLGQADSKYLRDLKLNLKSTLQCEHLSEKESALLALAIAANANSSLLLEAFRKRSAQHGAHETEIAEALACASLLAANNVFYRFRHFMQSEKYNQLPARFRMNIMMNPVNGKEFFELISLAISAVNGCEMCVRSHEESLRKLGCNEERIFDAIRLSSIAVSLTKLF